MSDPTHATLVARYAEGRWRGLLLRGRSGRGKSSVALALIGRGWRLAADDRVIVWSSGGKVWGRAPDVLRGLLEVRGVGVLPCPTLKYVQICTIIDGVATAGELDRIPAPATTNLCGIALPICRLNLTEASAADRVVAFCGALRV